MNFRFEELFRVEFHHRYYGPDELYKGIQVSLAAKTQQVLLNNNLLYKPLSGGFIIAYQTDSANKGQSKTTLFKTGAELVFRLDLLDRNFYNYTDNLPGDITDLMFDFRNYNPVDKSYRKNGRLQKDDLIGKADMNNTFLKDYYSKPFGQISIKLDPDPDHDLPQKFILQFDTLSTYRQYILHSDPFRSLKDPAILDRSNQTVFEAPAELTLPDGSKALSIVSKDPVPLTSTPQHIYRLVYDFNTANNSFKELKPALVLPDPDINLISNTTGDKNAGATKKYSVIYL
jgi:hypothetical protein